MFQRKNVDCILLYVIDRNTNNQNNFLIPNFRVVTFDAI